MAPPRDHSRVTPHRGRQKKRPTKIADRSLIFGSGGRTRTCDLRVMSPTSCQLLHPAIVHIDSSLRNRSDRDRSASPIETRVAKVSNRHFKVKWTHSISSEREDPTTRSPMNRPVSRPISSTRWHSLNDLPHRPLPTNFSATGDELVDQSQ